MELGSGVVVTSREKAPRLGGVRIMEVKWLMPTLKGRLIRLNQFSVLHFYFLILNADIHI